MQALGVALVSVALGLALPHSFFEQWGFIAGPAAWIACAAVTARALALDLRLTLAGAALAGLPSAVATLAGAHWAGAALAVGVFACWCGWLAARRPSVRWT